MAGSPGGLARIDKIFHSSTYTGSFSSSPIIFGAFPSLHSGCSTLEGLFIAHFFPQHAKKIWLYVGTLYWATMYLTHHFLIDVTVGACLAVLFFYITMPASVKGSGATRRSKAYVAARQAMGLSGSASRASKYTQFDLERHENRGEGIGRSASADSNSSEEAAPLPLSSIRSPNPEQAGGVAAFQSKQAKSHKHTASIASLIHANDRVEEGWSPVVSEFSAADKIRGTRS